MAEERHERTRSRRQADEDVTDAVLRFLGDLESLGVRYEEGQRECRRMFEALQRQSSDTTQVVDDLRDIINGDPEDRERFPGLRAVVHDLAEAENERAAVEKYEEVRRARRRLVVGTVVTVAGGGVFSLLALILSILKDVTP